MLSFGQFDGHEFMSFSFFFDYFRVLFFADFAEEFLKIVVGESFNFVFLDFRLVPFLKAGEVDQCAWAWTFAGAA